MLLRTSLLHETGWRDSFGTVIVSSANKGLILVRQVSAACKDAIQAKN